MSDNAPDIEKLIATFNGDLGKVGKTIEHQFNLLNGQMAALTEVVVALLDTAPIEARIRALSQLQDTRKTVLNTKESVQTFALWEDRLKKSILLP
ncbi:hypothetical protein [Acetobacter syzygii]|uniref:hypothetical protein n=1 Tax=Acetobacter syzygii TaxID=146476 RepID=UPI0039E8C61C